ncbi:glycosyl hydrolase [Aspergillus karnatakaensis]|uniref:endo 1,5-alpha-arabinase n=1 Tax=Aspergillus karnatakaensis TaxID=1810916 RepID=UPI003CCD56DA
MVRLSLVGLVLWLYLTAATPIDTSDTSIFSNTEEYPLANQANVTTHDPNILHHNNKYYLFRGGVNIPFFSAEKLTGPWDRVGTVLNETSIIQKEVRQRPWAPMVTRWNDKFYCFYSVSASGTRDSSIGLASSESIEPGTWTDHGAVINSGNGSLANIYPYNVSNAIDPAFFEDPKSGQPYLLYGSYWHGIFQIPLNDNLTVENPRHPGATHLVDLPDVNAERRLNEGSYMSYRAPWYYSWFSYGQCCQFSTMGFPEEGEEYSIRIGRSKNVTGPFLDRNGTDLRQGGGSVVYGSNHQEVYAPGGPGVLEGSGDEPDVLYYHYLNTSIGFAHKDARLGWNYLDYVDGWPVPRAPESSGLSLRPAVSLQILALLGLIFFFTV